MLGEEITAKLAKVTSGTNGAFFSWNFENCFYQVSKRNSQLLFLILPNLSCANIKMFTGKGKFSKEGMEKINVKTSKYTCAVHTWVS